MKYCFHCGEALSDEYAKLNNSVIDIEDLINILGIKISDNEVPYFCFKCKILYLADFGRCSIRWIKVKDGR